MFGSLVFFSQYSEDLLLLISFWGARTMFFFNFYDSVLILFLLSPEMSLKWPLSSIFLPTFYSWYLFFNTDAFSLAVSFFLRLCQDDSLMVSLRTVFFKDYILISSSFNAFVIWFFDSRCKIQAWNHSLNLHPISSSAGRYEWSHMTIWRTFFPFFRHYPS